jgi:sulfatase modifying factor 1
LRNKLLLIFIVLALVTSTAVKAQQPKKAGAPGPAPTYTDSETGMVFVFVKGGCFDMGDIFNEGDPDEKPVHQVCVEDFYIGKYEVTQGQWQSVQSSNPSIFVDCGADCPVDHVSWSDAAEFIDLLNKRTGKSFRLPTEAEWEYAARSGGQRERYAGTNSDAELGDYAWYVSNAGNQTHPVGQKKPNNLGIYDMTGNVWEWVADFYDNAYYKNSPRRDPQGLLTGMDRSLRGGSWRSGLSGSRVASRDKIYPGIKDYALGFRLALPAQQVLSRL